MDESGSRIISLPRLFFACMVAGGVQYGWALQLSLLTPYVQTLGISHALSSLMWLCGPIAGFVVQPLVGLWSDRCRSPFGRRRPFISVGCVLICLAVTVIGFSSDIGVRLGDTQEDCSIYKGPRWAAAVTFVLGFWILDFSNNAVQGPARALMADISGQHGCHAANAIFCTWMAIGNILGYASGASGKWHSWFPFLQTKACCEACANLKGAFLVAVVFLLICMTVTMILAPDVSLPKSDGTEEVKKGMFDAFKTFKNLPPGMISVFLTTALTWLAWFPFILFDTDWMAHEVYHGDAKGTPAQIAAFDRGVREGALGLLLNSVVLGVSSFLIEPLSKKLSPKVVWAIGNFGLFIGMTAMVVLGMISMKGYANGVVVAPGATENIRTAALVIFAALGFPLAVLYSVPFGVTSTIAAKEGGGQGLCIGILNISIVIPQVTIALASGPWDALFRKGNVAAFGAGAVFAFFAGNSCAYSDSKTSQGHSQTPKPRSHALKYSPLQEIGLGFTLYFDSGGGFHNLGHSNPASSSAIVICFPFFISFFSLPFFSCTRVRVSRLSPTNFFDR